MFFPKAGPPLGLTLPGTIATLARYPTATTVLALTTCKPPSCTSVSAAPHAGHGTEIWSDRTQEKLHHANVPSCADACTSAFRPNAAASSATSRAARRLQLAARPGAAIRRLTLCQRKRRHKEMHAHERRRRHSHLRPRQANDFPAHRDQIDKDPAPHRLHQIGRAHV